MVLFHSTTTKRTFKHLTAYDCGKIAILHAKGKSVQAIANAVGYHKNTISRELKCGAATQMISDRKTFQSHFPKTGQFKYKEKRKARGAKVKLDQAMFAESKIFHDQWSPDAVCGYVKQNGLFEEKTVYTKTIYYYMDQGLLNVKNISLLMKLRLNTKKKRFR
jgi:transposase, IS30 family